MKYWIFDGQSAQGPYDAGELYEIPGFGPETLICPEDSESAEHWKPARFYLIKPPGAKTRAQDLPAARNAEEPQEAASAPSTEEAPRPAAQPRPSPVLASPWSGAALRLSPAVVGALTVAALASGVSYYRMRRGPALERVPVEKPQEPSLAPRAAQGPSQAREDSGEPSWETPPPLPAAASLGRTFVEAFVSDFPVQSQGVKSPASPQDIFSPKKWRGPATLGEALEMKTLQALALWAADTLRKQGHTLAQGEKELSQNQERWEEHARRFLKAHVRLDWTAEPLTPDQAPQKNRYKVTARLRQARSPAAEKFVFEADLKARTLKPLSVDAWFLLDPKKCAEWGGKYLRLGEPLDESAVVLPSPTYALGKAKPAAAMARPAKPPPRVPAPRAAKPQPLPGEEDYDVISEEPLKAPPAKTSLRALSPTAAPAPTKPAQETTPAPPASTAPRAAKNKNATDMSVNELERYLKRPPAPESKKPAEDGQGLEP